jgi:hypothetical protein
MITCRENCSDIKIEKKLQSYYVSVLPDNFRQYCPMNTLKHIFECVSSSDYNGVNNTKKKIMNKLK